MKIINNNIKAVLRFNTISIFLFLVAVCSTASAIEMTDISFSELNAEQTEIRFTFDQSVPQIEHFSVDSPARLTFDFLGSQVALSQKIFNVGSGMVNKAIVIPAPGKSRVVLELAKKVPFKQVNSNLNEYIIIVGNIDVAELESSIRLEQPSTTSANTMVNLAQGKPEVKDIDFSRGVDGEGRLTIKFNSSKISPEVSENGGRIEIDLSGIKLPSNLQQRIDVTNFATPVTFITANQVLNKARIDVDVSGRFDHLSYQIEDTLTVEFKPLTQEEIEKTEQERFTGDRFSMHFQKIKTYQALNIIAQRQKLNLVAPNIEDDISLKLTDVPWDQALDVILKVKGLDKRLQGNVLIVAPAEQIAAQLKAELDSQKQVRELAPLRTKFIKLNYAKAGDIKSILTENSGSIVTVSSEGEETTSSGSSFVSSRGSISVDERTQTLIVKDTAENIEKIQEAIEVLDVAVDQVSIEARIVVARSSIGQEFGIKWGTPGPTLFEDGNNNLLFGGSLDGNISYRNQINQLANEAQLFNQAQAQAGTSDPFIGDPISYSYPDNLFVNLPGSEAAQTLSVGLATLNYALDLELSALETAGKAEVVSQPKIVTVSGQEASVTSGTAIPYRGEGGATQFRDAGLSLTVTPQIAPNNQMILDILVTQDSVGIQTNDGLTIDTNQIRTQVLVNNGDTLVLGGVYRVETVESTSQVPLLGSIPILGNLFKNKISSEQKNELLIFITPRLINDGIVLK